MKHKTGRPTTSILLLTAGLIVLVDQATKFAVKEGVNLFGLHYERMHLYESRQVLGDLLRFTFAENPGMAFGLDFGLPVVLSLFSIGAAVFLVHLLRKTSDQEAGGLRVALALILGGAVGNLIDRVFYGIFYGYGPLFYGKVVDFIDVDIPDIDLLGLHLQRFYVFNIADSAVSIGVILLLFFYPKHSRQVQADPADAPLDLFPEQSEPKGTSTDGTGTTLPGPSDNHELNGSEDNEETSRTTVGNDEENRSAPPTRN